MTKIEVGKSYNIRDGRQVRIYAVDGAGGTAIHGAVWSNLGTLGTWRSTTWYADGSYLECGSHDWDIVIKPLSLEGVDKVQSFGGCSVLFVPDEFARKEVKYTLEVMES